MGCKHQHGAMVPFWNLWVCGQCYSKLDSRPKRYGMATFVRGAEYGGVRQELVWQADIKKSISGTTLADFIHACAMRFKHRAGMDEADAYEMALDCIKLLEVEFGSEAEDWSAPAARDLADDEMAYWENDDGAGKND